MISAVGKSGDGHITSYPGWIPAAVLPMKRKPKAKPAISDRTRVLAGALWSTYPEMKPVGLVRQQKHLADLEGVLELVSETEVMTLIRVLRADKFRRDWVSSFERIAEELPRIRMAAGAITTRPLSTVTENWLKENERRV